MSKLIGVFVFKGTKSDKGVLKKLSCNLDGTCPVLERGKCVHRLMFGRCVYGEMRSEDGYTLRAYKSYGPWLRKSQAEAADGPRMPGSPHGEGLAVIGEHVWLPYAHMNNYDLKDRVKFLEYSGPFMDGGLPFIRVEDFTPEAVCALARFAPRGPVAAIPSYQSESVPAFLNDLKAAMPELYAAALAIDPSIEGKTPDWTKYKDAKVPVREVTPGTRVKAGKTTGVWDGEGFVMDAKSSLAEVLFFSIGREVLAAQVQVRIAGSVQVQVLDDDEIQRLFASGMYSGVA